MLADAQRTRLRAKASSRIGRLQTSNYDISNICNLRCEGCLYFSGAGEEISRQENDILAWRQFFAREARRGVNFAYLAGAEPSLVPDRIQACHDNIPMGVIFTNGTMAVSADISYRIHVSVWGDDAGSVDYRGASLNRKAMRNYAGDRRAVFVMTLNAVNLGQIGSVARACEDHGLPLTFSFFSPTKDYGRELKAKMSAGDDRSVPDLRLSADGLGRAREAVLEAADNFPHTVKLCLPFLDWVTQADSLYALDANGVATDCGNRLTRRHVHFNADLTRNSGKCCSPNLDCKDCRPYAMSLATYFSRRRQMPGEWSDVWRFWSELFLPVEAG